MTGVRDVARLSEIPEARGLAVALEANSVALFKVGDAVFAVDDACVRCGSSLASGLLDGPVVRCSACGWRYDVITGRTVGVPELRIDTFEATVSDGTISIANHFASRPRDR